MPIQYNSTYVLEFFFMFSVLIEILNDFGVIVYVNANYSFTISALYNFPRLFHAKLSYRLILCKFISDFKCF